MNIATFRQSIFCHITNLLTVCFFTLTAVVPPVSAQTVASGTLDLPKPGTLVGPTAQFQPTIIKGISIHPDDPLQMSFLVDEGESNLAEADFRAESNRMIKYFLAALTVPENELWVNLSPYEKNRIVGDHLGRTEMGRDLLAQDYLLKQLTSSMMYPEDDTGHEFWARVHQLAYEKFGTTEVPMNTFNKIWIVPEKAVIYEHANRAVIVESKLKVMLEEDYLALENHQAFDKHGQTVDQADIITGAAANVVREVLIPEIEKEINHGKTFSQLRQVYHAVILADWYKSNLKESLMGQAYVGQNKTAGIESADRDVNQKIYEQYVESFKKGVYNYIKEDLDPVTGENIPRHYFSGGADFTDNAVLVENDLTPTQVRELNLASIREVGVQFDFARPDNALIGDNLAKKRGVITLEESEESEANFFSVNRWLKKAFERNAVQPIKQSAKIKSLLRQSNVAAALSKVNIDADKLYKFLDGVSFVAVEDIKNGSPMILLRNAQSYRATRISVDSNTIYIGAGLVNDLIEAGKESMLDYLMIRELVGLYLASEIKSGESVDSVNTAVAEAEKRGADFEAELLGSQLDELVQESLENFLVRYYDELDNKNVAWDYETSVFEHFHKGKDLVGGKTYQLGVLWSNNPELNLRTLGATSGASTRFLQHYADLIPQIDAILQDLNVADDKARVQAEKDIRALITSYEVPEEIADEIAQSYDELVDITGQKLVAVRSSGKAEDENIEFKVMKAVNIGSNAGQHDSYLREAGREDVVRRWRDDISSLYTEQVLGYRDTLMVVTAMDQILAQRKKAAEIVERLSESEDKIDQLVAEALNEKNYKIITSVNLRDSLDRNGFHDFVELVNERRAFYMDVDNIAMGVTIMPMADAVVSFVGMGHAIDSSNWTAFTFQGVPAEEYLNVGRVVTLTFMYGIGESIVQGVTTPDTFLVHIFPNTEGEMQVNILDRQLGTKSIKAIPTLDVFEALDMNDELLEPYLRLMEGDEVNDDLFQARLDATKDDVRKALQKLIELSVDKTVDYKLLDEDETVIESFDDLVKLFTFENPDQVKLLAHLIKARLEDRTIKTLFTDVPQVLRDQFSVVDSQVVDVALEFMRAADGYGKLVDIEGAIGHNLGKSNTTVTVQRRESNVAADVLDPDNISQSYTYVKDKDVKTALEAETPAVNDKGEETDLNVGILLAQGVATRNSFSGTIYRINEKRPLPEQFEEIKALAARGMHIIIRTRETTPDYNAVLKTKNVMGVIADVGGATSHAAVMSRELGIATVVGIQTYVNKLVSEVGAELAAKILKYINTSGNVVTVDANVNEKTGFGMVYAGELPISKRALEILLDRLPPVFTKTGLIVGTKHPVVQLSKAARYGGFSGVALMRGEFAYADENINPRFGRAYDNVLVLDYLRAKADETYRESLSVEEALALEKFEVIYAARQKLRSEGVEVALDTTEARIEQFLDEGVDAFLANLNEYARRDIDLIRNHTEEIGAATAQMVGYLSYNEFFDAIHGGTISTMAASVNIEKDIILARGIDFKKNEAAELIGSRVFDPEPEVSTMIGERGARWLLQPENQVILAEEIRMMLRQVAKGYRNIGYFYPFVSTPDELGQLLDVQDMVEREESLRLGRPIFLREGGMMTELPSNIIQADEYMAVMKKHKEVQTAWFEQQFGPSSGFQRRIFISFGTNDLTQLTLGADRDNPKMSYLFSEAHPFIMESIKHVAIEAIKADCKASLCGQAIVSLVNINPEAAEAILMMLGQTRGGSAGTDPLGFERQVTLAAGATLRHGFVTNPESDDVKSQVLLDKSTGFTATLNRGAAARRAFFIDSVDELKQSYIGDYIAFANGIEIEIASSEAVVDGETVTRYTIVDEALRDKISRVGAVILPIIEGFDGRTELVNAIKQLRVPVIQTSIRRIRQLREAVGTNGQFLTIDFNEGVVYNGQQDTLVKVQEMISEINFEEGPAPQEIAFDVAVKSSQIHRALGVHPLTHITGEVGANKEKYQKALRAAILKSVGSQKSRSIVYETLDLDSDDFVRMRGHEKFMEEAEINPALGFAGLDALVKDKQWNELFRLEMQVVAGLIAEGYNISVQFNSVKVPESVEGAIAAAREAGLPKKTPVGMNTAWPGNYLFLGQYLDHGLSFVTLNERRLAQGYLAADLYKNPSVMRFYTEEKVLPNLKRPIAMILKAVAGSNASIRKIGFTSDNAALAEQDAAPTPTSVIYQLAATLADKDKGRIVKLPSPYDVQYSFNMDELRDYKEDVEAAGRILFRAAFDSGINWRRALGIPYRNLVDLDEFSLNEDQVLFVLAAGHALGSWDLWPNEGSGQYSRAQVAGLYQLDEGTTYPVVRFKPGTRLAAEFMSDAAMSAELTSYGAKKILDKARSAVVKIKQEQRGEFVSAVTDIFQAEISGWTGDGKDAREAIVKRINVYMFANFGIKGFNTDQDGFDYEGKDIKWFGIPVYRKSLLRGMHVVDISDRIADVVADHIESRFGLKDGNPEPEGLTDAIMTASGFVEFNLNKTRSLAFSSELHEKFQQEADRANGDVEVFFKAIYQHINNLRLGMFVFEDGRNLPRMYGDNVITWLNRIVAVRGPDGINVVDGELVYFVDALVTLVVATYTSPEIYVSQETAMIDALLEDPINQKQFRGDNKPVLKLTVASAMSSGLSLSNPKHMSGPGILAGTIIRMNISDAEKVKLIEELSLENLWRKPQITPFRLAAAIFALPNNPRNYGEVEWRLRPYLALLKSGALDGYEDAGKVLRVIDEYVASHSDQAQTAQVKDLGGIDLDPNLFDLERKGDGTLVFPKFLGSVEQLNINGLVPIIINVTPVPNLPLILGMIEKSEPELNSISYDSLDPSDNKILFELDPTDQLSLRVN